VQRCQGAPATWAFACFEPSWASDTTSCHAGEAAFDQSAEKLARERLRLALAAVEPDHLAAAALVHGVRDHEALAHDAAAVSDFLHLASSQRWGSGPRCLVPVRE